MTDRIPGDDVRAAVCLTCEHCYKNYDGIQCRLDPHGNLEARAAAEWLRRPYFRTCPLRKKIKTVEEDGR